MKVTFYIKFTDRSYSEPLPSTNYPGTVSNPSLTSDSNIRYLRVREERWLVEVYGQYIEYCRITVPGMRKSFIFV